jgi:hypothetical protein
LKDGKKPEEILEELFIRCFSRKPTEIEIREIETTVYADPDREKALEDAFWSLLNSREFLFNH